MLNPSLFFDFRRGRTREEIGKRTRRILPERGKSTRGVARSLGSMASGSKTGTERKSMEEEHAGSSSLFLP
jgi:hypothetical protein